MWSFKFAFFIVIAPELVGVTEWTMNSSLYQSILESSMLPNRTWSQALQQISNRIDAKEKHPGVATALLDWIAVVAT